VPLAEDAILQKQSHSAVNAAAIEAVALLCALAKQRYNLGPRDGDGVLSLRSGCCYHSGRSLFFPAHCKLLSCCAICAQRAAGLVGGRRFSGRFPAGGA